MPSVAPPPNTIPEPLIDAFTLNAKIPIAYYYCNNKINEKTITHNTALKYKIVFALLRTRLFCYYGIEINAFYDATKKYPLKDRSVIIWGLAGCNCEAIALWRGAKRVYAINYNKPICDHKKVEVYNHEEFIAKNVKADIAFSYSSFEHDGLGRYGDPLDPNGDLRAMQEARKTLKDDGILFLGVPIGRDCLCWNAHRIYGEIRLPMLLKGWRCVDVFDAYHIDAPSYPFELPLGQSVQFILVCKKILADFPTDEELTNVYDSQTPYATNNKNVLEKINKIILAHKTSV
ncbi:MAG: DUF268 domain-containing protein [Helicobacteraceae bacterium]|nr:DUF268 domain-containing protein [Helicobacteraceae bacterium]